MRERDRREVVELATQTAERCADMLGWKRSASCLLYAATTFMELRARGVPAILQAGTASWPRVLPEQDDGVSPTHFCYSWEDAKKDDKKVNASLANGLLPEMHVWAAIVKPQTIIDISTRHWPEQCKLLLGRDWPGIKPPDYLWFQTGKDRWPKGVVYFPDEKAIEIALLFLNKTMTALRSL